VVDATVPQTHQNPIGGKVVMTRSRLQVQDRVGAERWLDEGGHVARQAAIDRETAPGDDGPPLEVVVAGGGVAALELVLALTDLANDRVNITLVAPDVDFTYRPPCVAQAFARDYVERYRLAALVDDLGVRLVPERLAEVCSERHEITTTSGAVVPYDTLVLAVGARPFPPFQHAITVGGEHTAEALRGLVSDLELGYVHRVAFVVPSGASWTLPLYELAIMTARAGWSMGIDDVRYWLVTPEREPLAIFGAAASVAVHEMLEPEGITFVGSTNAEVHKGVVLLDPRAGHIEVDRVVCLPLLDGPGTRGVPTDVNGFIAVDADGRVPGLSDVYAVGDATTFPVKQGGLACQQADAVAELIAATAGVRVEPTAFRPVLRGRLMTGGRDRFLRDGGRGGAQISEQPLWWPPTKVAGRYLSPYLLDRDAVGIADVIEGQKTPRSRLRSPQQMTREVTGVTAETQPTTP
jgi:sulfide:quinone oxidoreductase